MSFYHKPELALRRALELESINQSEAALTLLHDVLSSRRHRTWSPTYEQIMLTYLNLCLKLHKSREAKDGLHQYRNLSQSQAPGSLEKVIRYLMEQAEKKCADAKASADAVPEIEDADDDDDEFGTSSPQAILLSTMSADPAKTQRDSTLLMPSLKFLWETYRTILDILKSNSKLEHVYHAAALGALRFCRVYKRRTEFRRLCDMLRMHLGNLQKYGNLAIISDDSKPNNKIRGWEGWTSEAIELHLQTRFEQLETASALHLYTEGFRTVEDIFNILQVSNARRKFNPSLPPPKAKLMAAYYEKLTTLFWVSENYLFHAFAWYKYYTLCKEYNRGMSEDMKRMQASAVLLAALCIPSLPNDSSQSGQHGLTSTLEDDIVKEKMARMATLLGFHTRHPTREALLAEIRAKNIMDSVPSYLRELYELLEESSDPLLLVEKARPLLDQLKKEIGATTSTDSEQDNADVEDNTLARYVKPLTSVLLLKLLLNLSTVYHTVSLDFLKKLTAGLDVSFEQVETAIVHFTQKKTLSCRIDHRAGCLRFGDAELESEAMRSQLTVLAKQLELVCKIVDPPDEAKLAKERAELYSEVRSNLEAEHSAIIDRKNLIEKRKEEAERMVQEKIKADLLQKAEEEAKSKADEAKRLEREKRLREKEKVLKIKKEMANMEKKKYLQAIGRNADAMTEEEIAQVDTDALQKEHAEKANKKREAAERKVREAAKRLDYLVRAVRIEELPLIQKNYEEKAKKDRENYEAEVIEKTKRAKLQWEQDVADKAQLEAHSVFSYIDEFEKAAMEAREVQHREICAQEDKRAEMAAEKEKIARARKRKEDEIKRQEEEEAARIAEEKARKEEEERQRKEEERLRKAAEEEKRRQAELARMQGERERKEKERQESMRAPPSKGFESTGNRGAGGGGGGKYVPPSQRNRGGGGFDNRSGSRPSYSSDRGGGYGGGRYEGRQQGGGEDGWGSGRGRASGSDRGSDRRSFSDRDRRDERGGSGGGSRRWAS